ncbi:Fe-S cluster assembly protein SufD [Pseudokineococcus basanitobsidens]|uniref:Fe-S cluster assembly protein SufD n=1 Tax=Pseudokineococcus basanitobsidens TaxID=1926649 RepID=A0ABU8RLP5_9ACTN
MDHAADAPAAVTLDSSVTPGPGYDTAAARVAEAGESVLEASRGERPRSFDPADFPVPTGREEVWRFTPLDRLGGLLEDAAADEDARDVVVQAPEGVHVGSLARGEAPRGSALVPEDRAAALADVASPSATHVRVPREAELDEPVHVSVVGRPGRRGAGHLVVEAGRHSRSVVVVEHTGGGTHADAVEAVVEDGAELTLVSLQLWDDEAVQVSQQEARLGRDSRYRHIAVTLGGAVVRLSSTTRYDGPGGDAEMLGVYFADAGQHLEHRSFVDHAQPRCRSDVRYKGALQGETARTVWIGDVLIRAAAQGTDTYELNRNLVLTDGARADSVPNLEIETGDIEGAGHASATGRFDDEQLFYLRSRGIAEEVARRLVVRGFFADVVQRIGVPAVTDRVMAAIEAELDLAVGPVTGAAALADEAAQPALAGSS